MFAQDITKRIPAFAFASITAVSLFAGSTSKGHAQVDPNLQSRIETYAPPLVVRPLPAPQVQGTYCFEVAEGDCRPVTRFNVDAAFAQHPERLKFLLPELIKQGASLKATGFQTKLSEQTINSLLNSESFAKISLQVKLKALGYPIKFNLAAQQPALKVTVPFNPAYETNAQRVSTNPSSDYIVGVGGGFLYTGPGLPGRALDVAGIGVSSNSVRYSRFPSKSFDSITVSGAYQFFMNAFRENGTRIDVNKLVSEPSGLITVDTISVGFQNATSFSPTFNGEQANLLTPQLAFNHLNVPLPSGKDNHCRSVPSPTNPSEPPSVSFCNSADFVVTAGQTISDVATLQNANIAASMTLNQKFDLSNFSWSFGAVATGRTYELVSGGRRDLQLQFGPTFRYALDRTVMLSLAMNYIQNYSTVSTSSWHTLVIQPALTIQFAPELAKMETSPRH